MPFVKRYIKKPKSIERRRESKAWSHERFISEGLPISFLININSFEISLAAFVRLVYLLLFFKTGYVYSA